MAKNLIQYHKKQVKMLAYLISRKHVPIKNKREGNKRDEMFLEPGLMQKASILILLIFLILLNNILFRVEDVICCWELWKSIFIFLL